MRRSYDRRCGFESRRPFFVTAKRVTRDTPVEDRVKSKSGAGSRSPVERPPYRERVKVPTRKPCLRGSTGRAAGLRPAGRRFESCRRLSGKPGTPCGAAERRRPAGVKRRAGRGVPFFPKQDVFLSRPVSVCGRGNRKKTGTFFRSQERYRRGGYGHGERAQEILQSMPVLSA